MNLCGESRDRGLKVIKDFGCERDPLSLYYNSENFFKIWKLIKYCKFLYFKKIY